MNKVFTSYFLLNTMKTKQSETKKSQWEIKYDFERKKTLNTTATIRLTRFVKILTLLTITKK